MISVEVTPENTDDSAPIATHFLQFVTAPGFLTALVIIVAASAVTYGIVHHRTAGTSASNLPLTSIPAGGASSLSVQPLAQTGTTGTQTGTTLQSAAGGGSSAANTPSAADAQLGAGASSSLGGGSASSYQSTDNGLSQFSGQSLAP